ncbi:MAG: AMP-binding protein [Polaribacter sp.]
MGKNKLHKKFQLNGISFTSVDELLKYSLSFSEEIHLFLNDWFSKDNFILVQTSGSTGKPKSIQLQKELMVNSALATGTFFDTKENTKALLCLSTKYIAGKMMLVRALTLGWQLDVVVESSSPLKTIEKSYDFSAMVPLQLENSLEKLDQIKKLIVGGGAVSNQLKEKLQNKSAKIFATYGMTETITHIAVKKLNNFSDNFISNKVENSFYQILPNVTIYKDARNCLVIDAPKVSKEIIFTNDVVNLISDTQFEWLGRFDNVINSGSIKLQPEKIEEALSKIIENRFFVAGIPDDTLGEKLVLIIENVISTDSENSGEKSLKSKISKLTSLSKFEKPKQIYFIDKFIETETKKIQRKKTLDLIEF